jgi:predicted alpha/beta superfamily hydrolase
MASHGWVHHTPGIDNPAFGKTYPLSIYTPPGYEDGDTSYPVAYMFDGQNLYFDGGSHSGGWHLHEVLDRRANEGETVPVVVGIHNGGETRLQELTAFDIWDVQGHGAAFLDWITGPLQAHIRANWRILAGPQHTMVGGSSAGGFMSLYAFFRRPDVFGKALVMSTGMFVDPADITSLSTAEAWSPSRRIYMDAGHHEPPVMVGATRTIDHLQSIGFRLGDDLMWVVDPEGHHDEQTWHRHLPTALDFLYAREPAARR